MTLRITLVCALAAFAFAGCGKGLKPLTDDQKAVLSDTLASAGRSSGAAQDMGVAAKQDQHANLAATSASTTSGDPTRQSMEGKLRDKKCEVDFKQSPPAGEMDMGALSEKVSGGGCPVSLDMSFSSKGTASGQSVNAEFDFNWQYQVNDDDFRKLNDVDQVALQGSVQLQGSGDSSSGSASVHLDIEGKFHSQVQGDIQVAFKGDMSGSQSASGVQGKGEIKARFDFTSFSAEYRVTSDGSKTQYFVNDQEVDPQAFMGDISKLNLPIQGLSGGSPQAPSQGQGQQQQIPPGTEFPQVPGPKM
jgi:hypothetical protein